MFRRPHYIVLGLVVVLTLVVLNLNQRTAGRLKLAIGGLFLPLFGLSSSSQQATAEGAAALLPRGELLRENNRLQLENDRLRVQNAQFEDLRRENDRLRQFHGWQPRTPSKLKLARIVARDPANWWRTVQIDLGTRDGLTNHLPVLAPAGLVGRIAAAGLTRSQVVLIGDPDCQVSALIVETRDHGIIAPGAGAPLDKSLVVLTYLPSNNEIRPGQSVVTSGLGGIFPKGIPIGVIADVQAVEFGLRKDAQVKLAANLPALEEVWVMLP